MSAHAITKQGQGLPYSFELMSRGLGFIWLHLVWLEVDPFIGDLLCLAGIGLPIFGTQMDF